MLVLAHRSTSRRTVAPTFAFARKEKRGLRPPRRRDPRPKAGGGGPVAAFRPRRACAGRRDPRDTRAKTCVILSGVPGYIDRRSSQRPTTKEFAHGWFAVAAKPIRPPTFTAVRVRRLPPRRLGVARRTGPRVGRDRLHRASCVRPLVDPVPMPERLHGLRRTPDRGD